MKAKSLTQPKKKKCSKCGGDLVTSHFVEPLKSLTTGKEICVECKVQEACNRIVQAQQNNGTIRSRSMEIPTARQEDNL